MKLYWLASCVYLVFVVDRIEPPYAVIEWSHSATFEQIPQNQFPSLPHEGQMWAFHSRNNPTFDETFDTQKPWYSTELARETQSYKLRPLKPKRSRSLH